MAERENVVGDRKRKGGCEGRGDEGKRWHEARADDIVTGAEFSRFLFVYRSRT